MGNLKRQWNDSCKAVGLIAIGRDTAAKLLAIVYVLGGERETFVLNAKMNVDIDYIRDVYGFHGGDMLFLCENQQVIKIIENN